MATNQAHPEEVISDSVKAVLEKLSKNAEVDIQTEAVTYGNLVNSGFENNYYLVGHHDWSGKSTAPYPAVLPPTEQDPTTFEHRGPLPGGSKGAIVFGSNNEKNFPYADKYLVAFDRVNNKVYIEVGELRTIDWDAIEAKLDASGRHSESHKSYCLFYPGGIFVAVFYRRITPEP